MSEITKEELFKWCSIPWDQLETHPDRKIPLRICQDSLEMGKVMARELVDEIQEYNVMGEVTRAIIPCGPTCWYKPFTDLVNSDGVSLKNFIVFHMDECLDWQGRELPIARPLYFCMFLEKQY